MKIRRILIAIAICAVQATGADSPCPYESAQWDAHRAARQRELLESPSFADMEPPCMEAMLGVLTREADGSRKAIEHLHEYFRVRGTSKALFFTAVRTGLHDADPALWRDICAQWERERGSIRETRGSLTDAVSMREADTLYTAFAAAGALPVTMYFDWSQMLQTLRDYTGAGRALCALAMTEPRMASAARSRFAEVIREADTADVRVPMEHFIQCIMAVPGADTGAVVDFASRTFAQAGMYADEMSTVVRFESPKRSAFDPLLRIARRHTQLKRYEYGARAARMAWSRAPGADVAAVCAGIVYETLAALGEKDSARIWLERAGLASIQTVVRAIAYYQEHGELKKADSLLATITTPGLVRDTLSVRQRLFEMRPDSARAFATRMRVQPWWRRNLAEAELWGVRTAVYSGDVAAAKAMADSLRFDPSWPWAREVLAYRYYMERYQADGAAATAWPNFEYALYRGDVSGAQQAVGDGLKAEFSADFATRLVRAYMERREYEAAVRVARIAAVSAMPAEHMYYCAEVLAAQGDAVAARRVLSELLLKYPSSIYASKARLLLAKVQS